MRNDSRIYFEETIRAFDHKNNKVTQNKTSMLASTHLVIWFRDYETRHLKKL